MKPFITPLFVLCASFLLGNNIKVSNVTLASQNVSSDFYMVEFVPQKSV